MKTDRIAGALLVAGCVLLAMPGCTAKEGPAEHAGKEIDVAVDKAADEIDQAAKKTSEKVGERVEQVGAGIKEGARGDRK